MLGILTNIDDIMKEIEQLDDPRFKDRPVYTKICFIIGATILCISGPIGTYKIFYEH